MGADWTSGIPLRSDGTVDIDRVFEEGPWLDEAMHRAFLAAIKHHEMTGVPMVFWRDGKVVEMSAAHVRAGLAAGGDVTGDRPRG